MFRILQTKKVTKLQKSTLILWPLLSLLSSFYPAQVLTSLLVPTQTFKHTSAPISTVHPSLVVFFEEDSSAHTMSNDLIDSVLAQMSKTGNLGYTMRPSLYPNLEDGEIASSPNTLGRRLPFPCPLTLVVYMGILI